MNCLRRPRGDRSRISGLDPLNRSQISLKEIKRGRFLQKRSLQSNKLPHFFLEPNFKLRRRTYLLGGDWQFHYRPPLLSSPIGPGSKRKYLSNTPSRNRAHTLIRTTQVRHKKRTPISHKHQNTVIKA